uniref:PORR domain-containing protein n=1 Tax=Kalanchoe fedtschenkoi TaxID=63787 RepID=A0A7N0U097_KALFE
MFIKPHSAGFILANPLKNRFSDHGFSVKFTASMSNLKVAWRKDWRLDEAIQADKHYKLCARVVREMLNEPGQVIPLRYLENRRERLRSRVKIKTFIDRNPGLFETYYDKIKPKTVPVVFVRASERLEKFLEEEKRIYVENEMLIVAKLCKLLMMAKNKVISVEKLFHVKRDFGFPNDFMVSIVPKYDEYFRIVGDPGEGNSFLQLAKWNPEFAKSVIELRAEEEEALTGIGVRPNFNVKLPPGFVLKKEMREWVRDWLEMAYVSPYDNVSHLDQASPEMEKRTIGVFHELLSLSLLKRMPVPTIGKFSEEFRLSNAFSSAFTRHSGIFYLSLKGGIKTAVLREAYRGNQLVDRDPLLEINERFVNLLAEGHREKAEAMRLRREAVENELKKMAAEDSELDEQQCEEE